jgi:hypothetical protein
MNNSSNIASNASLNNASLFELHYSSLIIFMVIILTINFSGAVANGIIFIATMTYRPLHRSSSSLLLAHCILLDFFTTICVEPSLVLVTYFGSVASLPKNFCHGFGPLLFVTLFANNWSHATLAINRFIAAAFPHQYKYFVTRPALITAVTFPWLVSGMLNLFPIAQITVRYELARGWRSCTLGAAGSTTRNVLLALGLYFPCLVIGLCYSIVLIKARISIRRREGDNIRHVALRKRHEASKMLFMCFIWYCISNFCVPTANSFFSAAYIASPLTQLGLRGLQYISSAVNPVSIAMP